jgi:hypothetical protein
MVHALRPLRLSFLATAGVAGLLLLLAISTGIDVSNRVDLYHRTTADKAVATAYLARHGLARSYFGLQVGSQGGPDVVCGQPRTIAARRVEGSLCLVLNGSRTQVVGGYRLAAGSTASTGRAPYGCFGAVGDACRRPAPAAR